MSFFRSMTSMARMGPSRFLLPTHEMSAVTMSRFQMLVGDIRKSLGPSGLTSDKVNVQELSTMMERYVSQPKDWTRYALSNDKMPYTRNLVDDCNDQANLLVLVWTPGKGSPIHDHGNAHCLMKILHGNLTETRYDFPNGIEKPMQVKSERVLKQNSVAYMADELGLHRVSNQGNDFAVSLHLYTPPNVARQGCNIFNPETGKKTHIAKCGNYSAFGRRLA